MSTEPRSEFDALPVDESEDAPDSSWRKVFDEVFERIQHSPIQNLTIILAVISIVIGLSLVLLIIPEVLKPVERPVPTLAAALAALDAEEFEEARHIAADLRLLADLPEEEAGGPAYVLGVVMAHDGDKEWERREKKLLLLLATRYLKEARRAGFPNSREGHGLLVLGKAEHDSGRFAESLEPLQAALEVNVPARTEIHGLLASAYLNDAQPRYDKAVEHNRAYLADDALGFERRHAALLLQAEIQFRLGELATSKGTLSMISADSEQYPISLLLKSRIVLREADALAKQASGDGSQPTTSDKSEQAGQASNAYETAREILIRAQGLAPADDQLNRQSQYLMGLAYRRVAPLRPTGQEEVLDLRAAAEQFGRTRRTHFDTAEGVSAALEEAEVLQFLGEHDEAVEAFRRCLRYAGDLKPYNNPWVPLPELQARVEAAYRSYRESGDLRRAISMARATSAVFPKNRAVQLEAEAQEAQAIRLAEEAGSVTRSEAELLIHESRMDHRQAGALFARLSTLRFATRQYPDDLWRSAENYMRGHDYERAVAYYKKFLDTQNRQARPPALTAIGQAMLALNKPGDALPWLEECIEFFPRDPHSYRARIIAAQAHSELSNVKRAKQLLQANLEHDALTPRALEWRESLFALGDLHFSEGMLLETRSRLAGVNSDAAVSRKAGLKELELAQAAFREAIRSLSEAVQRDPAAKQAIEARYRIAESHRHAAKLPRKRLPTVTIDTTRKRLNAEINRDLAAAESGYVELLERLNGLQEQGELSDIEERILRNCYFARADALYDMARYDEAIQAYSTATNRYQHQPESLEAYVQIANCHRRKDRYAEARGTLEQAKVVLRRIRSGADFEQTTRYDRKQWGELLDWLASL